MDRYITSDQSSQPGVHIDSQQRLSTWLVTVRFVVAKDTRTRLLAVWGMWN